MTETQTDNKTARNYQDKPFRRGNTVRPSPRREEADDTGSVQDCYVCKFAFFSTWETDKPFSKTKATPDPEDLECERCVTERVYLRNMQLLSKQ